MPDQLFQLTALALGCAVLTRFVDSPKLARHADALLKSTLDILCGTSKHPVDMHGNSLLGEGVHGFASSLIKHLLAIADAWMSRDTKRETPEVFSHSNLLRLVL